VVSFPLVSFLHNAEEKLLKSYVFVM
jgi:hypothetical protein